MKNNKKLLSVIIISFEDTSLVMKRAIKSVEDQSYGNTEIILVNANRENSDYDKGLREDMQEYPEIKVIDCPSEKGELALAKNAGAEASHGEYIGFLKAKFAWNPEYAENQIKVLKENPDVALVMCGSWDEEDDAFSQTYKTSPEMPESLKKDNLRLLDIPVVSVSQIMFRRETFLELHGFDVMIRKQDEYDIWLRAYEKYRIAFVERNLVCNYVDKSTLKKSKMIMDVVGYLQLYSKHKSTYDRNPEKKLELYTRISQCYMNSKYIYCWIKYAVKIKLLRIRLYKPGFLKILKKKRDNNR